MNFIKVGKIITDVKFTAKEQEALDRAIQKQLAEHIRKNDDEIDASFLWSIHETLGLGHKNLKKVHRGFAPTIRALCNRYEMDDRGAAPWLCTQKLLDYGIDIRKWNEEIEAEYGKYYDCND